MSILFWGLALTMLVAATAIVIIPLRTGKQVTVMPRLIVAVSVPLVALGLYAGLGSPDAVVAGHAQSHPVQFASTSALRNRPGKSIASVGSLVAGLRDRLQQEPGDASSWLLLARSYEHLGRNPEAILAYQRARSLGQTDSELEKLLPGTGGAGQDEPEWASPALRGRVALSPAAASRVNPDDTVFIFAKESLDHRMPVVALRKPASDLPIDFILTDEQVMVPGTHLADFESLIVTARISRSGLATDVVEGLEVWSEPVTPVAGGEIQLLIAAGAQAEDRGNE